MSVNECQEQAAEIRSMMREVQERIDEQRRWNVLFEEDSPLDFESERLTLANLRTALRCCEQGDGVGASKAMALVHGSMV